MALTISSSITASTSTALTTRRFSTDKKAVKAGGLYLALNGVAVKPTDEIDVEKEYELIAIE